MRIMEAEDVYRPSINGIIDDFEGYTWNMVRKFIWSFTPPTDAQLALLGDVDQWEKEGKNPSEVIVHGKVSLKNELLYSSAKYISQSDNLTWIASRCPPEDTSKTFPWTKISPAGGYLTPFTAEKVTGGFLTLHGKPRMGKTGIGCLYGEMWLEEFTPPSEVLSNIPLLHPVPRVVASTDMPSLGTGIAHALIAGVRWLWIWDEPTLSRYGKGDAATGAAKNLDRFARIIPKLGGSLIYIEHRIEGTPTVISDFAQSHITCVRPKFVLVDLPGLRVSLRDVPKPKLIEYRTGQPGYFELEDEFNWAGFFHALRFHPEDMTLEDDDASAQGERILTFLEAEQHKPPKRGPGRPKKEESPVVS